MSDRRAGSGAIRVFIVAAAAIVRAGLAAALTAQSELLAVGSAATLAEVEFTDDPPDVVLVEGEGNDWDAVANLAEAFPVAVMLLADELEASELVNLLRQGVRAILPRNSSVAEIVAAVEAVALGLTCRGDIEAKQQP